MSPALPLSANVTFEARNLRNRGPVITARDNRDDNRGIYQMNRPPVIAEFELLWRPNDVKSRGKYWNWAKNVVPLQYEKGKKWKGEKVKNEAREDVFNYSIFQLSSFQKRDVGCPM